MKFIKQENLPQPAKCLYRVKLPSAERSERRSRFCFNEGVLQLAMQKLNPPLSRERGTMVFQVFLADPDRQRSGRNLLVELGDATHSEIWQSRKITKPAKTFQHFRGGTAAPIPVTEREQCTIVVAFASEPAPGLAEFASRQLSVVPTLRVGETMRQHTAAIDAFPPVEIVGERVTFVPSQFVGKKIGNAGREQQLRQIAVESKRVR